MPRISIDSLLDAAPGLGPPADRREERRERDDFDDDDPGLEDLLDRMDSGGNRRDTPPTDRDRRGDDTLEPDNLEPFEDEDERPPEPRRERRDNPDFEKAEAGLGHKVIAGLWSGTVEEVGADPYTIRLALKEDGTGTAAYSNLNCASEIIPVAGKLLEYRETITKGARRMC